MGKRVEVEDILGMLVPTLDRGSVEVEAATGIAVVKVWGGLEFSVGIFWFWGSSSKIKREIVFLTGIERARIT